MNVTAAQHFGAASGSQRINPVGDHSSANFARKLMPETPLALGADLALSDDLAPKVSEMLHSDATMVA